MTESPSVVAVHSGIVKSKSFQDLAPSSCDMIHMTSNLPYQKNDNKPIIPSISSHPNPSTWKRAT